MNLTIPSADLLAALSSASRLCGKNTLPILTCLRLEAVGGHLKIAASNLDRSVSILVPAEVKTHGALCCSASRLIASVSKNFDFIQMKADDKTLVLRAQNEEGRKSESVLSILPADEFVTIPAHQGGVPIFVEELRPLLVRGLAAVHGLGLGRDAINGLRCSYDHTQKLFEVTATNFRALCTSWMDRLLWSEHEHNGTIPTSAAGDLLHFMPDEGEIDFHMSEKHVSFATPALTYIASLVDLPYPNWRQVVPDTNSGNFFVKLERETFLESIQNVSMIDKDSIVRVLWESDGETATLTSKSEVDQIQRMFPCKSKPFRLAFNGSMVARHLAAWTSDEIRVSIYDEITPFVIEAQGCKSVFNPLRQE